MSDSIEIFAEGDIERLAVAIHRSRFRHAARPIIFDSTTAASGLLLYSGRCRFAGFTAGNTDPVNPGLITFFNGQDTSGQPIAYGGLPPSGSAYAWFELPGVLSDSGVTVLCPDATISGVAYVYID